MEAQNLTVTRWKRWGKDRLYVKDAEDAQLGWWDLATGEAHPEDPELLDVVSTAAMNWCTENDVPPYQPAPADPEAGADADADADELDVAPDPVVHPEVPTGSDEDEDEDDEQVDDASAPIEPWTDLAGNRAGAGARDIATTKRDAAPTKTFFARLLGVHTEERAWRLGAAGEEKVAAKLAHLTKQDPRWRVLHNIPVGTRGSDIDHLVVGPGGLFTLNTKFHPFKKIWVGGNTFMVDGVKQPYIRNSRFEAKRATDLLEARTGLPVRAHGVVVTVRAGEFVVKAQPVGVTVVQRGDLVPWLRQHGEVLTDAQVEEIFEAARRSTTWRN
ncbi:nuclease-related domain-containing protein [Nocardioides yefusunii]|uniref:Nuclease-related domain-containing protein n=1 Tax=Nocardioides yefusunii TaxID=2500546 RepID=A0ABW1R1Q0_9ACTN|nr:nuclease-related domain-containing protein [Nocardioides yefusunii]